MHTHRIVLPILLGLLCGCAHEHFTKGHGDVGQFILEHAVAYGGHRTTTKQIRILILVKNYLLVILIQIKIKIINYDYYINMDLIVIVSYVVNH